MSRKKEKYLIAYKPFEREKLSYKLPYCFIRILDIHNPRIVLQICIFYLGNHN